MAKQYHYDWSFGNTKLAKEGIASFGIPAFVSNDGFVTCPSAGICAKYCYARQGRYTFASTQAPRERNLWKLRAIHEKVMGEQSSWGWIDFIADIVMDVEQFPKRIRLVRIHDSGDFFTEQYYHAWLDIARMCPHITFYAYSKMINLINTYQIRMRLALDNLHIVQSYGGKEDQFIDQMLPHTKVFPTHDYMLNSGYIDGTHSDKPAYNGCTKIGLVYHGSKKLSQSTTNNMLRVLEKYA